MRRARSWCSRRRRAGVGLRVKWTRPAHVSAADLVCLIAGVDTRREASVVVSELKDKLLQEEALGYRAIKGYPKRIPCLRFDRIDVFLQLLPTHYMVSEAEVQQFRDSAGQMDGAYSWLVRQLGEHATVAPLVCPRLVLCLHTPCKQNC